MTLDQILTLPVGIVVVLDSVQTWSRTLVSVPRLRGWPKVPVNTTETQLMVEPDIYLRRIVNSKSHGFVLAGLIPFSHEVALGASFNSIAVSGLGGVPKGDPILFVNFIFTWT